MSQTVCRIRRGIPGVHQHHRRPGQCHEKRGTELPGGIQDRSEPDPVHRAGAGQQSFLIDPADGIADPDGGAGYGKRPFVTDHAER